MEKTAATFSKANFKSYYILSKPGIIFGNIITAASGFALVSFKIFSLDLFFSMLLGLICVIASACVFNNYIDRHIDAKMPRTQKRPLVTQVISLDQAFLFGASIGLIGLAILSLRVNSLCALMALTGFIAYVLVYTYSKQRTSYGTLIGSIAGAMPPLVGYTALSNQLDLKALLLFLTIVMWQMPHFYAIAIYRIKDYAAGEVPVLPIIKGITRAKFHMLFFVVLYLLSVLALSYFGFATKNFARCMGILSLVWIWLSLKGFSAQNDRQWAKKMFLFSLVIVLAQSFLIAFMKV